MISKTQNVSLVACAFQSSIQGPSPGTSSLLIQTSKTVVLAQIIGPVLPTWELCIKFLVSGFTPSYCKSKRDLGIWGLNQ